MLYNSQQTCYTEYIRYISFCIAIVRFYISEKCQKGVEHHEVYHYRKKHRCNTRLKTSCRKLERYFTPETEIHVTLSVQKEHQKIEVTIPVKGTIIRSEQVSSDMYVSIDLVEEVIERQLRKYKNKLVARQQEGGNFKQEFFDTAENTDEDEIKIVRTKKFGIKPMYPEDACIQMELLGHDFYVFCNAETEEVNVVYKRKNGSFGLIEPEFS